MPSASGSATAPITFGSYGTGQARLVHAATVWLDAGRHGLVFDDLDLSAGGAASGIFTATGSGTGVYDVVLRNSYLHDTAAEGVDSPQHADHDWLIEGNTISHTGDSGLILSGASDSVVGNTVTDTGWNTALAYGKHGLYAKGPDMTIANNDFSADRDGQAISLRYHGARVYGNTIHDTSYGIGFFDYDLAPAPQGTDYVYSNRFWNVGGWGFYYDNQLDPQGKPPSVAFVLANNTFQFSGASEAVNASLVPSAASVQLVNNVFEGSYGSGYRGCATCIEHNNDWSGAASNVPSGAGDLRVDPVLSAPAALAPSALSPVVDRGSTNVAGLSFVAACDGQPLHYCGVAPDIGAAEFLPGAAPAPVDVTPPSAPTGLAVTGADGTSLSIAWTASTDDTRVAGYDIFLNGVKVLQTTSVSATVTGLSCGTTYALGVQAFDAAGNRSATASTSASTSACPAALPPPDTIPPSVTLSAKADQGGLTVDASATDAGGIRELKFLLNGHLVCDLAAASGSCRMTVTGSGWNTVTVEATDNAGNVGRASLRVKGPKAGAGGLVLQPYGYVSRPAARRHVGRTPSTWRLREAHGRR
jgi:chitodextrinase